MPQAFLMSRAAGGVLVMKVKLLSEYTVMTTGIIMPMSALVRSLKSLVNWPMFTPYWPRAGPTGGAGVALPAGTWNLIYPTTFCAIYLSTLSITICWPAVSP